MELGCSSRSRECLRESAGWCSGLRRTALLTAGRVGVDVGATEAGGECCTNGGLVNEADADGCISGSAASVRLLSSARVFSAATPSLLSILLSSAVIPSPTSATGLASLGRNRGVLGVAPGVSAPPSPAPSPTDIRLVRAPRTMAWIDVTASCWTDCLLTRSESLPGVETLRMGVVSIVP